MPLHSYLFSSLLIISSLLLTPSVFAEMPVDVAPPQNAPSTLVWKQVMVEQDDNLTLLFLREGLTERDVYRVTHIDPKPDALFKLKPGQTIQLALSETEEGALILAGLRLATDGEHTLEIIASETGYTSQTLTHVIEYREADVILPIVSDMGPNMPTVAAEPVVEPTAQDIALGLVWKQAVVEKDDNLTRLFLREGLTERDVYLITQAKPKPKALLNLLPGQTIRLALHDTDNGELALQELQLEIDLIHSLTVTASETGFITKTDTRDIEYRELKTQAAITSSLFMAGKQAELSDKVIMQLASLFNWDIDFALDIRENDSFSMIYQQGYLDGEKIDDVTILAAEFTNQGQSYRAIRYTNAEGETGYFTPKGESMRKAFIRTPIDFARVSSHFNLKRRHPILNRIRAHKGVDYAASRGTPIKATGRATIKSIGTQRGYGRTIVLKHAGTYTTLYAHMNSFAKGLRKGSRVKQGQTIGYVGSSGLATGPHLHYEFRINGVHRNPLTVKLPRSVSLAKKYQADFKLTAQPLIAKLDVLSQTHLTRSASE